MAGSRGRKSGSAGVRGKKKEGKKKKKQIPHRRWKARGFGMTVI
jgi:hypothetical protein